MRQSIAFVLLLGFTGLLGCLGPSAKQPPRSTEQAAMRHRYNDSTLHGGTLLLLLPYNCLIAPAGHVVR